MAEASRPTVLLLGRLQDDFFAAVAARFQFGMKFVEPDSLGHDLQQARVLLIGDGVAWHELESMLPTNRDKP